MEVSSSRWWFLKGVTSCHLLSEGDFRKIVVWYRILYFNYVVSLQGVRNGRLWGISCLELRYKSCELSVGAPYSIVELCSRNFCFVWSGQANLVVC